MNDGKAAGIREMIHLGNFFDASTTASGAIVYQDWTTKPLEGDVFVTLLDTQGHVSEWRRLELRGKRFPNSYPWPSFSPDGSAIVYSAPGAGTDKTDVVLRELASGKERTLYTSGAKETPTCQFASRLRKIYCASWNNHDKTNLFSVSVETCALERISSVEGPRFAVYMSENDMSMYFLNHIGQSAGGLLRWDMATQKEVTLATRSSVSEVYVPSVDERWLVRVSLMSRIDVRPMSGGEWRPLVSNANGLWTQTIISPNGKSVVYHTIDLAGRNALFSVPIAGGPPERLGDFPCDFLEASCT
jgi:Tol biopolymer transport system component